MPLYTDSSGIYWATSSLSSNRDQYSSYLPNAYVSYSRPLTYSLPSSSLRSNYTTSRYRPNLSTITETPYASRGLTPLTRINSPKVSTTTDSTSFYSTYVPPRPININTADIDVSETRFKSKYGKYNEKSSTSVPITTITEANESKPDAIIEATQTDLNNNNDESMQEIGISNQSGSFKNRSTIKRNRAVVRLSISRPKNAYIPGDYLTSPKKPKVEQQINGKEANTVDSTNTIGLPLSNTNNSSTDSSLSWRQKVGEDLLKPIKNVRKSPGDIMREKHIIPVVDSDSKDTESELNLEPKENQIENIEVPENLKPKDGEETDIIVELNSLTHTAVRRLSIPKCPDFEDFCKDISSDKLDDDLNAGALRRRASLIQEQEQELLNQLQKSASGSVQFIHLERVESPSDLIPSAKKKSKKKRIRHKITATVDVDNALPLLQSDDMPESLLESDTNQKDIYLSSPRKSPKISYKVDEIEENQTVQTVLKLPKKKKVAEKTLETVENKSAIKNSPKKVKAIKKPTPSKGRDGKVEVMKEITAEEPKQKKVSEVINKPNNAKQSEIVVTNMIENDSKLSKAISSDVEKPEPKTCTSMPASPLKKSNILQKNKSAASLGTGNKLPTTTSEPEYFKFDEESISNTQKLNTSWSASNLNTPKSATEDAPKSAANKSRDGVKLRIKTKPVNKLEKSDSGEDFWNTVGSRETIYFNQRKQSLLELQWNKRESFLDDENIKNVPNLNEIKEKVSAQKNEELQEAADYIEPTGQTENRRAGSNESALCDKSKGIGKQNENQHTKETIQKTETPSPKGTKTENQFEINMNTTPTTTAKTIGKDKTNAQPTTPQQQQHKKINDSTKILSGTDAKSPEINDKLNGNNKKNISILKLSSDIAVNKTSDSSSPGTLTSPTTSNLNKFATKKKDVENDVAKGKEKLFKLQSSRSNDAKSSAFNEQGKEIVTSKSATEITTKTDAAATATTTDAKSSALLNKSDVNKNRIESEIGSSVALSTKSITSPKSLNKDELLSTTTPPATSPLTDNIKKLTTENVAKHVNQENTNLEKDKFSLSLISKNTEEKPKKIGDKDKIKTNKITTTTTTNSDSTVESGKTSVVDGNDVKNDNKFSKINSEIASDAKIKNKSNTTTATNTTKTKINTTNDKATLNDNVVTNLPATATTTSSDVADSAKTKLANNVPDDKSIDNSGSIKSKKKKNLLNSNSKLNKNSEERKQEVAVGERASQQLSFKKVLNKNREQKLEEFKKNNNSSSGGGLQKFDTISNLNECLLDVDAELKDYSPNNYKLDKTSDSDRSDSYSSSCTSDSMKRKDKKQKQKLAAPEPEPFNRNRVKLDHTKKLYVKDETANKYQLIATPRPLWKPEKFAHYNSDSSSDDSDDDDDNDDDDETTDTDDSECETSSGDESGGGNENDELNPHQKNCLIRMSTCSNDSGFVGGTAPTNPKKMLGPHDARDSPSTPPSHNPAFKIDSSHDADDETSYTYAQFQKTGRITAPATNIPRFKKYAVEDFHFLAVLGKGSFGKVLLAELRNSDYYYAVKCLKKDVVLEDDDVECTLIERKVLALGTKHPYLCHLFCTFQTESHLFFVMEYLNGGDLMFHIQQSGRFPEPRARFYAAEIVSGLKFLHKKGVIYRDLKLDNVLLDFEGHVRIADFGMCKLQIYLDKTADSFCGTPDYMAPEIIKGDNYNQNVDWWSFGVLLYEMLIGQSPFSGCDEEYLFWSICNEIPMYPMCLSQEATNLLKALLEKDSAKRIGSQYSPQGDILVHPFFVPIDWDLLEKRQIEPPFKPQVKHPLDTKYFDKTFTRERVRLTPIDKEILHSMDQAQFQGFSYTNPNATLD